MFEKRTILRVENLLATQFYNICKLEQTINSHSIDREIILHISIQETNCLNRSTNERNMTRKTRSRRPRIHSVFQSGYCAVCHVPYSSLEDHIHSKRHVKLIGEDGSYISIKGFDSFLALDGIDSLDVTDKNYTLSSTRQRNRMPRTRAASVMCERIKHSPMSPVSDSGHRLRSRKNINYMTPPLDEDSLTEKPEVVKEFRELRSSSRLLAKLADQIENDDVWNSGRPKRTCNRQRISADERLVVDNQSYYKVEVLPTKLRSGVAPFQTMVKRSVTPVSEKEDDKDLMIKFKKLRNSELVRLNTEAENFLFPKKDESSEEDDDEEEPSNNDDSYVKSEKDAVNKIKHEDEESMHSTSSESKGKKKRRTHAEAFIMDNQKYYKFETPGSRLRYHGSYLSPVPMKFKNNGDCTVKNEPQCIEADKSFKIDINDYHFSFENVPKKEDWYQTFQRRDTGEEKYAYLNDNYWNPLILPYQLDHVPPLDPRECISQYNQIRKCLMEPPSTSTSITCSTPDPNASNSSAETPFNQDEDSKISATEVSSVSTLDEIKPSPKRGRKPGVTLNRVFNVTGAGKNPRKSPRQHASTLAILSSLIHQRKRKTRRTDVGFKSKLPTILEDSKPRRSTKKPKIDYITLWKSVEEELADRCDGNISDIDIDEDEEISFKGNVRIEDILNVCEPLKESTVQTCKKILKPGRKPGRKPGKRKKNRTGWPLNRNRRLRRDITKEEDDSTVDSLSVNADLEEFDVCEDINSTDNIRRKGVTKLNSENNNKNDQSSLGDVNIEDTDCDLNNTDRVVKNENKSVDLNSDKVLTNKVNSSDGFNIDLQYQPYVRVQKLDKTHIDKSESSKRSTSPKRTNRGQRRMPASPKSPRMLRRPRGRWYRER